MNEKKKLIIKKNGSFILIENKISTRSGARRGVSKKKNTGGY